MASCKSHKRSQSLSRQSTLEFNVKTVQRRRSSFKESKKQLLGKEKGKKGEKMHFFHVFWEDQFYSSGLKTKNDSCPHKTGATLGWNSTNWPKEKDVSSFITSGELFSFLSFFFLNSSGIFPLCLQWKAHACTHSP